MASEQIKRLIDEGKITLTLVVSPPRCKSTAIAYALSRGDKDTCYLHEPVSSVHGLESSDHGPEYNIEERDVNLDNLLLPRIEKAIAQAGDDSKPIPIVIKEMSNGISMDEFGELAKLSKQIVFLQCDPSKQIASALTIIAKDDPLISNPVSYMPEWGAVDDLIYSPWKRQTALLHNAQNNFPGKVTVLDLTCSP